MVLQDKIPAIYHALFPELLSIEFPEEQIATCNNCTLCRSLQSPYINTKCCAYHPHMPNYLLGGLLCDADENLQTGKERIRLQIKNKLGVTPYGIIPSEAYSARRKIVQSQDFWNRPHDLMELQRCPYYDEGKCTVWKYRENLCVTYFCSSIGGSAGTAFWNKLNKYIKMAETSLAQYTMLQLGWPVAKIKTDAVTTTDFELEDKFGKINETNYKNLWGVWETKEEEFYKQCYKIVAGLDAATFKKITGLSREILELAIRETKINFESNILPEFLSLHPQVVIHNKEEDFIQLELQEQSVTMPAVIYPIIRGFNGKRSTAEVFHLGYNVVYSINKLVNELREKGFLINAES